MLILLMRNPDGLNVSQLAKGTSVSRATMTGVVNGFLKGKLVTRETDAQDRCAYVVRVTKMGQSVLDAVLPLHYQRVSRIMSDLDASERDMLRSLLGKVKSKPN